MQRGHVSLMLEYMAHFIHSKSKAKFKYLKSYFMACNTNSSWVCSYLAQLLLVVYKLQRRLQITVPVRHDWKIVDGD